MPRKKLIRSTEFPYHVTCHSNNRQSFYLDINEVWNIKRAILRIGAERFQIECRAHVLMSNHYHMLIKTPQGNLGEFMQYFNSEFTRKINRRAGRINRVLGGRYKWSLIESQVYYNNVLRYIYQNPVRAGIVEKCSYYPFSDLQWQPFGREFRCWIEKPLSQFDSEKTRRKLRRYHIKTP